MSKKPNSAPVSLHKVIMVGSGGVGKSAVSIDWAFIILTKNLVNWYNSLNSSLKIDCWF